MTALTIGWAEHGRPCLYSTLDQQAETAKPAVVVLLKTVTIRNWKDLEYEMTSILRRNPEITIEFLPGNIAAIPDISKVAGMSFQENWHLIPTRDQASGRYENQAELHWVAFLSSTETETLRLESLPTIMRYVHFRHRRTLSIW